LFSISSVPFAFADEFVSESTPLTNRRARKQQVESMVQGASAQEGRAWHASKRPLMIVTPVEHLGTQPGGLLDQALQDLSHNKTA